MLLIITKRRSNPIKHQLISHFNDAINFCCYIFGVETQMMEVIIMTIVVTNINDKRGNIGHSMLERYRSHPSLTIQLDDSAFF